MPSALHGSAHSAISDEFSQDSANNDENFVDGGKYELPTWPTGNCVAESLPVRQPPQLAPQKLGCHSLCLPRHASA